MPIPITKSSSRVIRLSKQTGATLVITLIMLLILSMIGVSSVQNTTMTERTQSAVRDRHFSFQAAEIALRAVEEEVQDFSNNSTLGDNALTIFNDDDRLTDAFLLNDSNWNNCGTTLVNNDDCKVLTNAVPGAGNQPEYKVQCNMNLLHCYVTVRAYGRAGSVTVLQTLYKL